MTPTSPMPRLTDDLPHPRDPRMCQACGLFDRHQICVIVWREHDEHDRSENRFVALCKKCSEKLIEPHPRLYEDIAYNHPIPGIMKLCLDCLYRSELNCIHPRERDLAIEAPKPSVMFLDGTSGPKGGRRKGWTVPYYEPATSCSGRMTIDEVAEQEGGA